jgi:hypothetical protein
MSPSVVIHRAQDIESALVLVNFFQFHGLDARLDNACHASIDWAIVPALGGIAVRLPRDQLEEAKDLLRTALKEARADPDFAEPARLRPVWQKRLLAWSMLGFYTGVLPVLIALLLAPVLASLASLIPPELIPDLRPPPPEAYYETYGLDYGRAPSPGDELRRWVWVVLGFVAFLILLERVTRPTAQEEATGEHE